MSGPVASLQMQQLLELLAVVTSLPDETSAVRGAVERAAQALEAEVCAVLLDDQVVAAVGFGLDTVPAADLLAVTNRERDWLDVPGLDRCPAIGAPWGGTYPGHLVLARWGDPFTVEERTLVRGMARVLELTLTMLRTLRTEQEMRERSERQAAENHRLAESLREQRQLLLHLSVIQRAISRRDPLETILEAITRAAHELLGDEIVGLWVRDPQAPDRARLASSVGLAATKLPGLPLAEAGAAGEAMRLDDVVVLQGYDRASPVIREVTGGRLCASMAAPVHESGEVAGGLLVASYQPDRVYSPHDEQTLRTFAANVSLALTDVHTLHRVDRAVHDSLTGLATRGLFLERTADHLAGSGAAALLFIDLDRFKEVNDTLGHAAGDRLLIVTAERIRALLRTADVAGRFGGDEFAVLLPGVTHVEEAASVAERLVQALGRPVIVGGHRVAVNASIGIVLSTPDLPDTAEFLRRADIAMYRAKRNGRNRYEVFTDGMLLAFADSA